MSKIRGSDNLACSVEGSALAGDLIPISQLMLDLLPGRIKA